LGLTGLGLAALIISVCARPAWRLSYNPSASAPRGWYALIPSGAVGAIAVGDQVIVRPPLSAGRLADRRGYLPASVPLLKSVFAGPGAIVCRHGIAITVDGDLAAIARRADRVGRPLPLWRGCRRLGSVDLLVLGRSGDSYDGRYFGTVLRSAVIARAVPLWTW